MSRRIAFLWGSNGNNDFSRLRYADQDVARLEATLSSSRYGFKVIKPTNTSDPHAIHAELLEATAECTRDDAFVGYFSGHGHLVDSKLYLVLDRSVPAATRTMFSSAWLLDALSGCKASQRLLILDCCHAGAATGVKGKAVDVTALFPDHREERILYASGRLEAARELPELKGSFLTHRLCEELRDAPPGDVALSRIVRALERAADERNQNAALRKRVPVPFLSGIRQPDFYFTPGIPRDDPSGPRHEPAPRLPSTSQRNELRDRLASAWIGLRSAASDGQAVYVSTMLAFGLAAFFFHESLALQHRGHADLQDNIQQAQDPSRATHFPSFEGLVLPRRDELCGNKLLAMLTEITLEQAYLTFIDDEGDYQEASFAHDRFTRVSQQPDEGIELWRDVDLDERRLPFSQLWVPSALAGQLTPDASIDFCQYEKIPESPRHKLCRAISSSLAIGRLVKYLGRDIADDAGQPYHINALYYVSPEGVIRAIGAPPTLLHDLRDDPLEAHPACGDPIVQSIAVTSTLPHFDLARNGVVETVCFQAAESTRPPYGRLCAQLGVPEAAVFSGLQNAEAELEISMTRWLAGGDGMCANHRALCNEQLPGTNDKEADRGSAKDYYQRHLNNAGERAASEDGAHDARGVWRVSNGVLGAVVFHRPVSARSPVEYWDIVIARVRDPRSPNYFSLMLSAAALTAAAGLLVQGFRRKLRREQTLLARGLQYGLLELSDGRRIVGANDRAEEILGERLPKLGIQSGQFRSGQIFSPMISDVCVLLPSHGAAPSEADICSYDGKIRDRAADGLTSVFYAWVKRRQTWIKVTSTVIWLPNGTEHVFCALDTAIDRLHMDLLAAARARSTRPGTEEYAIPAD